MTRKQINIEIDALQKALDYIIERLKTSKCDDIETHVKNAHYIISAIEYWANELRELK